MPIQHEGSVSPYFDSKHPGHTKRSEPSSPKREHTMPNDDIPYLLKFAPKEARIENPMDGRLYINAAGRHHNLPNEQGRSIGSVFIVWDGHLGQLAHADLLHVQAVKGVTTLTTLS